MSVVDSEISYLGSGGVNTGGLAWRVSVYVRTRRLQGGQSQFGGARPLFAATNNISMESVTLGFWRVALASVLE